MSTTPEDMRDAPSSLALGVIGNGSVAVLIDGHGRIVWGCLPRFDGDASFCSLLSPRREGGDWTIQLEDFERAEQHYMPNTAVLITRLYDRHGAGVEIVEENLDECVLCRLCLDASPPGAVKVIKLYDDGALLT